MPNECNCLFKLTHEQLIRIIMWLVLQKTLAGRSGDSGDIKNVEIISRFDDENVNWKKEENKSAENKSKSGDLKSGSEISNRENEFNGSEKLALCEVIC